MIWTWIRNRRRRAILREPFPVEWESYLERNFRHWPTLNAIEQQRLRRDMQVLLAEKNWEGCFGLELTDEMRVTIAAQACYLVLGLDLSWYDPVQSILVYPETFSTPEQTSLGGGVVLEGRSHRSGEAWYRGPVILSWPDVLAGSRGRDGGSNLVFHEFAHQLDMRGDRDANGRPPLDSRALEARWSEVMTREAGQLHHDCRRRQPTVLDCYGTTNAAEFFAVATEAFFEQSMRLLHRHADLYQLLSDFYHQSPAERVHGDDQDSSSGKA